MRKKHQISILVNLYRPLHPKVEFEHRKNGLVSRREYKSTPTSQKRLDKTLNRWIAKGWATIRLDTPLIEVEL